REAAEEERAEDPAVERHAAELVGHDREDRLDRERGEPDERDGQHEADSQRPHRSSSSFVRPDLSYVMRAPSRFANDGPSIATPSSSASATMGSSMIPP